MSGQKKRSNTSSKSKKNPARGADPSQPEKDLYTAAAIVGQVMIHFGAGYGATNSQIFASPDDYFSFSDSLMKSTLKNIQNGKLQWDTNQGLRDVTCKAAYQHGALAKAAANGAPLTIQVILS